MKIWVMFSVVGAALLFFSDSGTTSKSSEAILLSVVRDVRLPPNEQEHGSLWLEAKNRVGSVTLEDYRPVDPSPSSKTSVKPGLIEHGSPLMLYMPSPALPLPVLPS